MRTPQMTRVLLAALLAAPAFAQGVEAGRKQFEARCAACHGSDGAGGERGPGIVETKRGRPRARESLRASIRNGIPGSGMRAFSLSGADMNSVLAYVQFLIEPASERPATGDAEAGARFFFGKGKCSGCHMVKGRGGVLGPELSNLAKERRLSQIEQALRSPGTVAVSYRVVTARLRDGGSIRGLLKNETHFDIQLQGLDGAIHPLDKSAIAELVREPKSLMPPVAAGAVEKRDLLAYL